MALATTTLTFFFFFIIILSAALMLHAVEAQQQRQRDSSNIISLGSTLTPTTTKSSSWLSMSGLYAFGFYPEGDGYAVGVFLAGIPEKTVVWTANRDDPPVPITATLALTSEGWLILQQNQEVVTYIANVSEPASAASMLDSGNFVLYNSNQDAIWQNFDYPTDTILPGQRLSSGQQLVSSASETNHSTGIFILVMQRDGNLVQYPIAAVGPRSQYAYWASGTYLLCGDNCSLNLDRGGHLYLLNTTSANILNITHAEVEEPTTTKEEKIYMMKIDADGIFRVYSRRRSTFDPRDKWSIWWNSTSDKCDPKGVCGVNAFCIQNGNKVDCKCLPGFASVNPGSWASGCQRNSTVESCQKTGGGGDGNIGSYIMSPLENIVWEDFSYLTELLSSRKECEDKCLQDCNCQVALYKDRLCKRQMLPLRFGKRLLRDSSVTLIKVVSESTTTTQKMWTSFSLICLEPSTIT